MQQRGNYNGTYNNGENKRTSLETGLKCNGHKVHWNESKPWDTQGVTQSS